MAIVTAVRAVAVLDSCLESGQKARTGGARRRTALDAAIEADDGDLDHQMRQMAQERRTEFEAVDETAAEAMNTALTFRITFKDPRPAPNSSPFLSELIAQRAAHEEDVGSSFG